MPNDTKRILVSGRTIPREGEIKTTTSFFTPPPSRAHPVLPDDVQTRLVQVGMKIRKNVSDGYKQKGSIPSYQGHTTGPVYTGSFDESGVPPLTASKSSSLSSQYSVDDEQTMMSRISAKRLRDDDEEEEGNRDELKAQTMNTAKLFYVPTSSQPSIIPTDDFEDATFLVSSNSD
jgi:hypothetical protein